MTTLSPPPAPRSSLLSSHCPSSSVSRTSLLASDGHRPRSLHKKHDEESSSAVSLPLRRTTTSSERVAIEVIAKQVVEYLLAYFCCAIILHLSFLSWSAIVPWLKKIQMIHTLFLVLVIDIVFGYGMSIRTKDFMTLYSSRSSPS